MLFSKHLNSKYIGSVPPRHKPFPRSQLKSPVQSSGLPSSRILFIQWPSFKGNGINIFISLHSQSNKIPYTRQKVLNILPIILFSKIAQQLRTKEGPRKILLFFTIVVKNNKLKQLRKLFYLHNSPVLTLLVNINISTCSLYLTRNALFV